MLHVTNNNRRNFFKSIQNKIENFHKNQKIVWGENLNVDFREKSSEVTSLNETAQMLQLHNTADSNYTTRRKIWMRPPRSTLSNSATKNNILKDY